MSSKGTLLLTEDNEMFYEETNKPHSKEGQHIGFTIELEFEKENIEIIWNDKYSLVIGLINPDSEIHKFFKKKAPEWEAAKELKR